MWTSIAAGLALFVGVAGWNMQSDVMHMFAPQTARPAAAIAKVSSGSLIVTAPATLQISYTLASAPTVGANDTDVSEAR